MKRKILEIAEHIDFERVNSFIKEHQSKKIVLFGSGTAANILIERDEIHCNVAWLVDNNENKWGNTIFGTEIKSPESVREFKENDIIVLIVSKHVVAISEQLNSYGMIQGKDYIDIYNDLKKYFIVCKAEDSVNKFLDFVDHIPDDSVQQEKVIGEKVGIVCTGSIGKNFIAYSFAQYLIALYKGYKPTLIVETFEGMDEVIYFSGITKIARKLIDYIISYLKEKKIPMNVQYIDRSIGYILTEEDKKLIQYGVGQILAWQDSRKDEVFLKENPERENICREILEKIYPSFCAFFEMNKFDGICVLTGVHKHRILYSFVCKKYGIRMCTYDTGGKDIEETKISAWGISSQSPDIKHVLEEQLFSSEELKKIDEKAKLMMLSRRSATVADNKELIGKTRLLNYQLVEKQNVEKSYDIVVPLNIFWDSAALNIDQAFNNWKNWIKKLITFVKGMPEITMMIREHPAQAMWKQYNFCDLHQVIDVEMEGVSENKIKVVYADEKINTYSYLEKAKLVLPYASTTALEAVDMKKPIVMHTDIYYTNSGYIATAKTEEEYFAMVTEALNAPKKYIASEEAQKAIRVMYYLKMKDLLKTKFTENLDGWMEMRMQELSQELGVIDMMECIFEKQPICYKVVKRELEGER